MIETANEAKPYAFLDGSRAVIVPMTPENAQKWANIATYLAEGRLRIGELDENSEGNVNYLGRKYLITRLLVPKEDK